MIIVKEQGRPISAMLITFFDMMARMRRIRPEYCDSQSLVSVAQ